MPTQSKATRGTNQALNKRRLATIRRQNQIRRHVEKIRRQEKRAQELLLARTIKSIKGKGIYEPKSLTLTKYRRYRTRKALKEYGSLLDVKKYFFVEAPKGKRKQVKERAQGLKLRYTRTGIFIEREGHRKATLQENKKTKELFIRRTGKVKRGPSKGKRYTTVTPLASVDSLDKERDRIRELAKELPLRNSKERFAFKIIENGNEGYSHATFSNIDLLLDYLDKYQKKTPAKVNFFRHIEIERIETASEWFQMHPSMSKAERRRAARNRRNNRR